MAINRNHLRSRHRMIPGVAQTSATVYRMNMQDSISETAVLGNIRFKENTASETGSENGPSLTESFVVHLYEEELNGWVPQERDILHVVNADWKLDVWVIIDAITVNLMRTRYICACSPTVAVE